MAERSVPQIVEQGGAQGDGAPVGVVAIGFAVDRRQQTARGLIDSDAVGEAGMGRPQKDDVAETELPDASQTLKLGRVDQPPGQPVDVRLLMEHHKTVDRIENALRLEGRWGDGLSHVTSANVPGPGRKRAQ